MHPAAAEKSATGGLELCQKERSLKVKMIRKANTISIDNKMKSQILMIQTFVSIILVKNIIGRESFNRYKYLKMSIGSINKGEHYEEDISHFYNAISYYFELKCSTKENQ